MSTTTHQQTDLATATEPSGSYWLTGQEFTDQWELQCWTHTENDDPFTIVPFLRGLTAAETKFLEFACWLKPTFRSGSEIDWEVLRRVWATLEAIDTDEFMETMRSLEEKGIIRRNASTKAPSIRLVWYVVNGKWKNPKIQHAEKLRAENEKRQLKVRRAEEKQAQKAAKTLLARTNKGRRFRGAYTRSGGVCVYCGRKVSSVNLDHVRPKSRGGDNSGDNLVLCCLGCNGVKGDRLPQEWALDILSYRSRIRNGKPSRLVAFAERHRDTLPRLAYRLNGLLMTLIAAVFLMGGPRR